MQIQIESTETITSIDGVSVRLWNGTTADGVPCLVYVHRIAVRSDLESQFAAELTRKVNPVIMPAGTEGGW